ncbi:MAG: hypothetical protein CSB47_09710 [Proteobacteria bacterium]|nr:MAG: hypothetical protein CSB47_09710 [Pseudomonadota bacterium]
MQTTQEQKRLLNCTKLNEITGCLVWVRQTSVDGFGRTMVKEPDGSTHMDTAHKASYMAFYGDVPVGKVVRQGCGNPLCINPEHLELVVDTQQVKKSA